MGSAASLRENVENIGEKELRDKYAQVLLENVEKLRDAALLDITERNSAGNGIRLNMVLEHECGIKDENERKMLYEEYCKAHMYIPNPVDTSHVELSDDLLLLTERLAENAHDEWALQRMRTGWTFGPTRNDELKKHPCLVPYDQLSEEEKEYDRLTAMKTLKLLISLGYDIKNTQSGD